MKKILKTFSAIALSLSLLSITALPTLASEVSLNNEFSIPIIHITASTTLTKTVKVTKVVLDNKTATVDIGSNITLIPTISPTTATNKKVTWKSSNTKIATVDSGGNIKGIKAGKATITVTTVDGKKTAKCTVTVKDSIINFNDQILSEYIIWAIPNKPNNSVIYKSEVVKIKNFQVSNSGIKDLSGIENLTNLVYLDLDWSPLEDISQLSQLTNLTTLKLYNNKISDLSPLHGLINLKILLLSDNKISDVNALKGLTNLKTLDLRRNLVSDSDKQSLKEALPNCIIDF